MGGYHCYSQTSDANESMLLVAVLHSLFICHKLTAEINSLGECRRMQPSFEAHHYVTLNTRLLITGLVTVRATENGAGQGSRLY